MRKGIIGVALLMLAIAPVTVAGDAEIDVHAELFARAEYTENFQDFTDTVNTPIGGIVTNDTLNFGFYRTRLGVNAKVSDELSAYVEIQNHGNWGDSTAWGNAQDPYLGNLNSTNLGNNNSTILYQGYVSLDHVGGSPVSVKFGRMEKTLGNELHMGDNSFYSGQYFDGVDIDIDFDTWNLNAFYFMVEERNTLNKSLLTGDPLPPNGGSDDSTVMGVSAKFEVADGHWIEPYLINRRENNEIVAGLASISPPGFKLNAYTLGLLYNRPQEHDSAFDWSAELAFQTGDVNWFTPEGDLGGYLFEGELGYTFGDEDESNHRLHIGAFMQSGDDNPVDGDWDNFVPLFPDTHGRLGMLDLFSHPVSSSLPLVLIQNVSNLGAFPNLSTVNNLTNYYLGWNWTNGGMHSIGAKYLRFELTEDGNQFFKLADSALGDEIDLWYGLKHSEHFDLQVGLAQFGPGDVFPTGVLDDSVLRGYVMGRFRM